MIDDLEINIIENRSGLLEGDGSAGPLAFKVM